MRKYKGLHDPKLIADARAMGVSDIGLLSWDVAVSKLRNRYAPRHPGMLLATPTGTASVETRA